MSPMEMLWLLGIRDGSYRKTVVRQCSGGFTARINLPKQALVEISVHALIGGKVNCEILLSPRIKSNIIQQGEIKFFSRNLDSIFLHLKILKKFFVLNFVFKNSAVYEESDCHCHLY